MLGYSVTGCSSRSAQVTRVAQRVTMSCPTARPSIIRQLPLYIVNLSEHLHVKNKVLDTVGGWEVGGGKSAKKRVYSLQKRVRGGVVGEEGAETGKCATILCRTFMFGNCEPSTL